jgi:hypothetical protein
MVIVRLDFPLEIPKRLEKALARAFLTDPGNHLYLLQNVERTSVQ